MDTLNIAVYIGVNRRNGRLSMLLVLDMIPLDTEQRSLSDVLLVMFTVAGL